MTLSKATQQNSWGDGTVNFIYGCKRVSTGCDNCYIDRYPWNLRLEREGMRSAFGGKVIYFNEENQIKKIDRFPDNSIIWANGLGDTFAEFIPDSRRDRWNSIFESRPQYQFVLCTKRPGRMLAYYRRRKVPDNVWVGTTVEERRFLPRLDLLKRIDAKIRWISFEPLLEDIGEADLTGISWATVGGETHPGRRYRPFSEVWAANLQSICRRYGVRLWFIGGNGVSDNNRIVGTLEGEICQEYPEFRKYVRVKLV